MAISASGLYVTTVLDVLDTTQLAINLISDTFKGALFNNSLTPNFSSDLAYAVTPYDANEITGTNYVAGGATLVSTTFTESPTGSVRFDATDTSWSSATFSAARGVLIWDDTISDRAVCFVNFGADFGVTSGTFTIQWAATGIFAIDLTP